MITISENVVPQNLKDESLVQLQEARVSDFSFHE